MTDENESGDALDVGMTLCAAGAVLVLVLPVALVVSILWVKIFY